MPDGTGEAGPPRPVGQGSAHRGDHYGGVGPGPERGGAAAAERDHSGVLAAFDRLAGTEEPGQALRPLVVIESPFAGDVELNLNYARMAMRDCIIRGETPLASHLLYTQLGILDDQLPEERRLGIEMGFQMWEYADYLVFYVDRGWSRGMLAAKERLVANQDDYPGLYAIERQIR